MLKFYRKMSKRIIICYGISLLTLLLMFTLSILMFYNATPQTAGEADKILIVISVVITAVSSLISCVLMQSTVISSEKGLKASNKLSVHLKNVASLLGLMILMGLGISFAGGVVFSFAVDMFTELRYNNFSLFCTVVKIPLFILFLVFLFLVLRDYGVNGTLTKTFNPHLMLIALILSLAFMLPGTVREYMYENSENRGAVAYSPSGRAAVSSSGKSYYNLQAVFSRNIDLYGKNGVINDKFSVPMTVAGILAAMAVQIAVAMTAYNMGRKKYYAKYPNMSEDELDRHLSDSP